MSDDPPDHVARLHAVRRSLDGLSVGDAFGDQFFDAAAEHRIEHRILQKSPWLYTDDTEMALAVRDVLRVKGQCSRYRALRTLVRVASFDRA